MTAQKADTRGPAPDIMEEVHALLATTRPVVGRVDQRYGNVVRDVIRAYNAVKAQRGGKKSKRVLTPDQARATREGKKQPPAE